MEVSNKKRVLFISGVTVLIVLGVLIYSASTPRLKITCPIQNGVTVSVDDKYYLTPANITVSRGKHHIYSHIEGYKDFDINVSVGYFDEEKIVINPEKLTIEGAILQEEDKWGPYFDEQQKIISNNLSQLDKKNPLTSRLPYFTDAYWFDYRIDDKGNVIYFLDSKNFQLDIIDVRKWIKSQGINPDDINIVPK